MLRMDMLENLDYKIKKVDFGQKSLVWYTCIA